MNYNFFLDIYSEEIPYLLQSSARNQLIKIAENSTAKKIEEDLLPQEHLLYKSVLREFLKGNARKVLLTHTLMGCQN